MAKPGWSHTTKQPLRTGSQLLARRIAQAGFAMLTLPLCALATNSSELPGMLDEQLLLLADIPTVYAASKYEQPTSKAPSAVSIITNDEIRKYGYRTLAELLESVPGFYMTRDRNYTYGGIRGFGRLGDYNTRFLLLVDGIRLNDDIYDQALLGQEFPLNIDIIDRIEIIRGPGSSLYGANAFFGVINVVTKRGRDYEGLEVAGSVGSFEALEGQATFGKRLHAGAEMLLSGTYFDSQGPDALYFPEFDDPATNNGVAEKAADENAQKLFLNLSYQDFSLQGLYGSREKAIPTGSYGALFNDPRTRTVEEQFYINLTYEHLFTNGTQVLANLNFKYFDYDGDYVYDYSEDDEPYIVVNKDYGRARSWNGLTQLTFNPLEQHKVVAGAEFRWKERQDQGNFDEAVYLDDQRDSFDWGVFLQDEWSIRRDLSLTAGLRYDQYANFDGTVNPRLALIYNPWVKTAVKVLYGSAFRPPNAYEQYYNDDFVTYKPADNLVPETIHTAELVLEQEIAQHLRTVGNIFYYKVEDLITLQTDPEDGLLVFRNTDTVDAYGVEGWLEGKWPSGWAGRLSYTFTETDQEPAGGSLSNSPQHLLKGNLIAPILRKRLFASLELQYNSERKTVRGNTAAGYAITNLTLYAPRLWKGFSISGSIYNLFDEQYSHPGSEEHLQDAILQDGRTFRVKLYYSF